jgi:hypothetical protein
MDYPKPKELMAKVDDLDEVIWALVDPNRGDFGKRRLDRITAAVTALPEGHALRPFLDRLVAAHRAVHEEMVKKFEELRRFRT